MNDQELFEFAAKAVGKSGLYRNDTIHPEGFYCYPDDRYWNPRDVSEDAFDLACSLNLVVDINNAFHRTTVIIEYGNEFVVDHIKTGTKAATRLAIFRAAAATRLAIFRAAAEVGKNLLQ